MDVSAALTWIPDMVWPCGSEHPAQEISRQILADGVAMSVRNFDVCSRENWECRQPGTCCRCVSKPCKRMLERTGKGLDQIALASGFSSADLMRRAFIRTLRTTPLRHRRQRHLAVSSMP